MLLPDVDKRQTEERKVAPVLILDLVKAQLCMSAEVQIKFCIQS